LVVNIIGGKPILLKDVATVSDGPSDISSYQWLKPSAQSDKYPLVTISVAKQKGSNAVTVSEAVLDKMAEIQSQILPTEIKLEVLRDYGLTANEKVNNLTSSLAFAVFTVVVFIGVFLGWRPAIVVGLAVPVCYGATLLLDMVFGYTINRVTLFALILSLGLLVDDPITGIDNIERFLKKGSTNAREKIVQAMSEIRPALLMSTLTIVLAFVPLAYITGMMGPYMAPMAFNVPVSVIISTLVAFLITPWLALKILRPEQQTSSQATGSLYSKLLSPLLLSRTRAKICLWVVFGLFVGSALLPLLRSVPLKLLPFDNKNEIQVLIDLPEDASLEQTASLVSSVSDIVETLPEVKAIASYVGQSSPIMPLT